MNGPNQQSELTVPPECTSTIEQLQLALDGAIPLIALDGDAHAATCGACRERIALARFVHEAFAAPVNVVVPSTLTDSILTSARADRTVRIRRTYLVSTCIAFAASIVFLAWYLRLPSNPVESVEHKPEPAPIPEQHSNTFRFYDELTRVGRVVTETSKPITDRAIKTPRVITSIGGSWTMPHEPGANMETARKSLADIPDAARTGLEPVATVTQKAIARLLREVGSIQTNPRPKS